MYILEQICATLDVGVQFFLLALVSDRIRFDGFECFRIRDVKNLEPNPYAAFSEAELTKRGLHRPKKPRVIVASVDRLLVSAARAFPLVTIHRESINPAVCWIGRVLGVNRGRVSMLEIGPDAMWDETPSEHRLNEISRVNFGATTRTLSTWSEADQTVDSSHKSDGLGRMWLSESAAVRVPPATSM